MFKRCLLFWLVCASAVAQLPVIPSGFNFPPSSPAFDPTQVTGLNLWLEADTSLNLTNNSNANVSNGDAVKGWRDKSSNGYHALAHNTSGPIFHSTGGGPSGTNAYITWAGTSGVALTNRCGTSLFAQPNTWIWVGHWAGGSSGASLNTWSNQNSQVNLTASPSSGVHHWYSTGTDTAAWTPSGSVWCCIAYVFNGASSQVMSNGVTVSLGGSIGSGNCPGYTLGNFFNYGGAEGAEDDYAWLWYSNGDTNDIHKVQAYFGNKIGFSVQ